MLMSKELTIFEKTQAVTNEVLRQGEEKFGTFETKLNSWALGYSSTRIYLLQNVIRKHRPDPIVRNVLAASTI